MADLGQVGRDSAPTHPPLLVLFPVHDDHVPLGERQLIWVVGHAVVEGFHPLGLQLGLGAEGEGSEVSEQAAPAPGKRPGSHRFVRMGWPSPTSAAQW